MLQTAPGARSRRSGGGGEQAARAEVGDATRPRAIIYDSTVPKGTNDAPRTNPSRLCLDHGSRDPSRDVLDACATRAARRSGRRDGQFVRSPGWKRKPVVRGDVPKPGHAVPSAHLGDAEWPLAHAAVPGCLLASHGCDAGGVAYPTTPCGGSGASLGVGCMAAWASMAAPGRPHGPVGPLDAVGCDNGPWQGPAPLQRRAGGPVCRQSTSRAVAGLALGAGHRRAPRSPV